MIACEACGTAVPDGNAFCTSCGAMLPAASPAPASPVGEEILTWERRIPLITNPYLVLQCIAIPLGIGLVLGMIFGLITGTMDMLLLFLALGGFMALVFLLVTAVLHIVTGGGLLTTFFIGPQGVAYQAGSTTTSLNRAATAGSVLAGSMGGTGAGILAMAQESNTLDWASIRYISVYPSLRSLVFRTPLLIGPVVLYCTEENYPRVLAMARQYALPAAARKLNP